MSPSHRETLCPPTMRQHYKKYHFSPAIRVGDMIWVSGQVGNDTTGSTGADIKAQTRLAFANIDTVLREAGASLADVVELVSYHTELRRDIGAFCEIKDEILTTNFPAWTAVGVSELAQPEYLLELRVVAVIGCGRS